MKRLALVAGAVLVAAALAATAVTFASSGGTTIEHDGENVTLAAAPGETVSGQTDLDPGTTLDVRLASTDASQPFLMSREATVAEDGSFTTTLDLSAVSPGATANLTVRHDDSVLTSETVAVVPCEEDCDQATETDESQSGTTVDRDGERLTLVAGPESEITGQSDLEPGTELELTLTSEDATNPFLVREPATVAENGSFAAAMDTSFVSEGTNASLTVRHGDEELTAVDVRIEPCEDDCDGQSSGADAGTPPSEFGLEEDLVTTSEDETAEIPVAVGDADAATLSVGGDAVNYQIDATARDGNGDGRVVFVLAPAAAGSDEQTMTVRDDGDSVTIGNETDVDGPLSPADYDLALYRGSSAGGDTDHIGTLSIRSS